MDDDLPATLTPDEAFRAAFYMTLGYISRGVQPNSDLVLYAEYLWTDPARWGDWKAAVTQAMADGGLADPDHSGRWQDRPEWPDYSQP